MMLPIVGSLMVVEAMRLCIGRMSSSQRMKGSHTFAQSSIARFVQKLLRFSLSGSDRLWQRFRRDEATLPSKFGPRGEFGWFVNALALRVVYLPIHRHAHHSRPGNHVSIHSGRQGWKSCEVCLELKRPQKSKSGGIRAKPALRKGGPLALVGDDKYFFQAKLEPLFDRRATRRTSHACLSPAFLPCARAQSLNHKTTPPLIF